MLTAVVALLRSSIDNGNQLPTASGWINVALGLSIEFGVRPIAGPEPVYLRPACVGVPRVGVDLGNFDSAAQIHAEASAAGPGVEEEVLSGLIFISWQHAIGKRAQVCTVGIDLTVEEQELCLGGRVVFGRQRHILEFESAGRRGIGVVIRCDLDLSLCR